MCHVNSDVPQNTILSWFPSQNSDYNNREARCMALTQTYNFRSNFCKTAQHVFYNQVIKSDMRSSNSILKIKNVFCRVLKIIIFSMRWLHRWTYHKTSVLVPLCPLLSVSGKALTFKMNYYFCTVKYDKIF